VGGVKIHNGKPIPLGRRASAGIQTKEPEIQAIKMATNTLTEKAYFLKLIIATENFFQFSI
jgi:hypothetical protein